MPVAYTVPLREPDPATLSARLAGFIDDAARRGALDAGSAAFADAWIGAHLEGWLTLLEEEDRSRRDAATWILAARVESLARAAGTLETLRGEIAELEGEQRGRRAVLRGGPDREADRRPSAPESATQFDGLLAGSQLSGLELATPPAPEPVSPPAPVTAIRAVAEPDEEERARSSSDWK
jgi:hypothetical protein